MIDDRFRGYFGAFIMAFAHRDYAASIEAMADPAARNMTADDLRHIRMIRGIRDLIVRFPVTGLAGFGSDTDGQYIADGRPADLSKAGIRVSADILRALARDAASYGEWWYDPTAPDGLSEYFPGRNLNQTAV